MPTELPGTLWVNRGRWNWRVKLPGEAKRKNFPLRLPGAKDALPEHRGRDLAMSLAWKMWKKSNRNAGAHDGPRAYTLAEVAGRFYEWADIYYRRADGSRTREGNNCEVALRSLVARFGSESLDNIGYSSLIEARNELETSGLYRTTINQRVGIWKRFIGWALENRLCQPSTKSEWCALGNLKQLRTVAPEGAPIRPVPHAWVKATLPYLPEPARSMVRIHELTGMRPGELLAMRACDIERRRTVWVYRPGQHKNSHRGQPRVIVIGPRAQKIIAPFVRSWKDRGRIWATYKSPTEYGQTIRRGVQAAQIAGARIEHWSSNQLRHSCGTRVRRKFGVEAAGAVLGHARSGVRITDRYTRDAIEAELVAVATLPMSAIG